MIHTSSFCLFFLPADDELLIERSIHKGMINPGEEKQTVEFKSLIASIEYTVRVRCDDHYYGLKCNKVCRPRDDYFGHYVCDQFGKRQCMEGWTGTDCKTGEARLQSYLKGDIHKKKYLIFVLEHMFKCQK